MVEIRYCALGIEDYSDDCDKYERDWAALRESNPLDPRLPMTELEWRFNELLEGR